MLVLADGGGALTMPIKHAPRCDAPSAPSTLAIAPFARLGRYLPPSSQLPLRVTIEAPIENVGKKSMPTLHVKRGDVLNFIVRLTNVSRRSFGFTNCPTYVAHMMSDGPRATYVLNCRPAGTMKPRGTARFAMRLSVPRTSRVGNYMLGWQLAPTTHQAPFTTARVVVHAGKRS